MAEVSAETKAIVERLKAEGDLIRNSGTNSIRSVKIQLDRFEGIFNTISANVVEQTELMRLQVGTLAEQVERQRTQEQYDEIRQNAPDPAPQTQSDSSSNDATNKKINEIGDSIAKAFSVKNLAMIGAAGFVGYNLLKGFIDEKGGIGEVLKDMGIDQEMQDDFKKFGDNVGDLADDVGKIAVFFGDVAKKIEEFANDPLSIFGLGLTAGALFGLGKDIGGGGDSGKDVQRKRFGGMKIKLLAGVVGLALLAGDEVANYIAEQTFGEDWRDKPYGDFLSGTGQVAEGALLGYSIGRFFGPYGAIAGAVIGAGLAFGNVMSDWIQKNRAEKEAEFFERFNEIQDILDRTTGELSPEERQELEQAADDARARLRTATSDAAKERLQEASKIIEDRLLSEVGDKEIGMFGRGDDFDAEMRAAFQRFYGRDEETGRAIGDDSGIRAMAERIGRQYDEGSWLDQLFWGDRNEFIQRSLRGGLDNFFFDRSNPNAPQRLVDWDSMNPIREHLEKTFEEGGRFHSFSQGSGGFQDFGRGEVAILHGREAVVPFNTAAGQFLDKYFDSNYNPRMAAQSNRINSVANSGLGGGTTIINAPTIAPSNVSVNNAGSRVNQTSITGGMGGGGSNLPYGLTGAFS